MKLLPALSLALALLLDVLPLSAQVPITAAITAPRRVFRDEPLTGQVELVTTGKSALPGVIYLKYIGYRTYTEIIDENWAGTPGQKKAIPFTILPFNYDENEGGRTFEILYRDEQGRESVLATTDFQVLFQRRPRPGENVLPNAGFEQDRGFCGSYFGTFDQNMSLFEWQGHLWTALDTDGWWASGPSRDGIEIVPGGRGGGRCLKLTADTKSRGIVGTAGYYVPHGPHTLSAYVKTTGAKASLKLGFFEGMTELQRNAAAAGNNTPLPENAADWTRVSVSVDCPDTLMVIPMIHVDKGTVLIDDVQVETGPLPTAFNVSPREFLRLSLDGETDAILPKWIAGDAAKRMVRVHNDSRVPLTGTINVRVGPWNHPDLIRIAHVPAARIAPGQSAAFSFSTADLRPDGYILSVQLTNGEIIHDGRWDFDPNAYTAWGSRPMLHSRAVARIALLPRIDPKALFGIGNTAIRPNGFWLNRSYIEYHADLREIGPSCIRGQGENDDEVFQNAVAGGIPIYASFTYDAAPNPCDFVNPCQPDRIDICNPKGTRRITDLARAVARQWAANPLVPGVQLANEQYWANEGAPCPTRAADERFREWCKRVHRDLGTLNERWGTSYTAWDQVDQVISERIYSNLVAEKKRKNATVAFPGGLRWRDHWTQEGLEELDRRPGKTMDWLRWRTQTGVETYRLFRDTAHTIDNKTLYTTDLPIPTFRKQFFIPFVRAMDAAMINTRYTSGYEISFGTPHEHLCDLEMAESLAREQDKPFWGVEVYQKPFWPPESAALQNWGLIAHGMNVAMIFSWGPFADIGVPNKPLAWKERRQKTTSDPFEKACWYMIDVDNARMPAFGPYVRSLKEIQRYHERFDGLSIKRAETRVAYYVSNDSCEYALWTTGFAPWGAVSERVCYTLIYLLRMNGITADFVDDATLPDSPGRFNTVIVPLAPVLSQSAVEKLARFARAGGTVVLAGASGRMDPWLRKYPTLGGPAWSELKWQAPAYTEEFGPYAFNAKALPTPFTARSATETAGRKEEKCDETLNDNRVFRGRQFGAIPGAIPITDLKGKTVGFQRPWGRGRLIAYGICPDTWTTDPHLTPHLTAWTRQLIALAHLPFTARWTTRQTDNATGSKPGTGAPVVDLVVRIKSPAEKFIFALNQGGAGKGRIEIAVGDGVWSAEDLIGPSRKIIGQTAGGLWQTELTVQPLGYRVLRLVRNP